jgi:cyclase
MPLAYGGGVNSLEQIAELFSLGVEKVVLNRSAVERCELVREAAERFGSQSIVVSIDARRSWVGGYRVYTLGGTQDAGSEPAVFASRMQEMGAGELIVTSIDRDGTMEGYDLQLIRKVASAVTIPVVASGGAKDLEDFRRAVNEGGASAVAAGSFFVFQMPHRAVLISFPSRHELGVTFGATPSMASGSHARISTT